MVDYITEVGPGRRADRLKCWKPPWAMTPKHGTTACIVHIFLTCLKLARKCEKSFFGIRVCKPLFIVDFPIKIYIYRF
jgi:hypothetical protein